VEIQSHKALLEQVRQNLQFLSHFVFILYYVIGGSVNAVNGKEN
jgi:hypothetical protein